MSSRKRGAHAIEERSERAIVIDGEDAVEEAALKTLFDVVTDSTHKQNNFQATPKEVTKFQSISADAQAQCVKTVVRLLIMKGGKDSMFFSMTMALTTLFTFFLACAIGGRRETISRAHIQEVLYKVDPEYKKLVSVVLMKAADELRKVFGIVLVAGVDIVGLKDGKKDDYYLTTALNSKKVRHLIARGDKDGPYFGFMVLVLYSVLMAPGQKQACKDILSAVRQVEPRFPVDLGTGRGNTMAALAVPELGDDFLGLIRRMRAVSLWSVFCSVCYFYTKR